MVSTSRTRNFIWGKKGQINGVGPLKAITTKEEPINLKRGKESSQKEANGMTYVLEQTLEPL
jgi:hypothetical protein